MSTGDFKATKYLNCRRSYFPDWPVYLGCKYFRTSCHVCGILLFLLSCKFLYLSMINNVNPARGGSAKSASQRAMRATVQAMRAMRVTRVMWGTVQMLRIFICFIYSRVRKFWTNFFLCFFFFFFRFCYNFGENFAYSKSPKMRKKIKTIRKEFIKVQHFRKKNPRKTYGCTAIRIGIYWHMSFIDIHVELDSRKKKEKNSTSISVCWRQEWWVNRAILTGFIWSLVEN